MTNKEFAELLTCLLAYFRRAIRRSSDATMRARRRDILLLKIAVALCQPSGFLRPRSPLHPLPPPPTQHSTVARRMLRAKLQCWPSSVYRGRRYNFNALGRFRIISGDDDRLAGWPKYARPAPATGNELRPSVRIVRSNKHEPDDLDRLQAPRSGGPEFTADLAVIGYSERLACLCGPIQ